VRPSYPLRTERLLLRPWTARDLDAFHGAAEMARGEWCDLVVYAILAEEWRPAR
jgi:RimJ/RimL family protein N-acetyltransferase